MINLTRNSYYGVYDLQLRVNSDGRNIKLTSTVKKSGIVYGISVSKKKFVYST